MQRSDAGAHADRARSGAPVSARAQQEPELRRRAGGPRRLRPQLAAPPSCRRRASLPRVIRAAARRSRTASTASSSCPRSCTRTWSELFAGMKVHGCYQFRVTRNSDLFVDEEEVKNLRTALQGELPQRHFGDAVRLEVADNCSPAHGRIPAAAVRARRRGPVPASTGRSTCPADAGARPGRAARPQVPAVPARAAARSLRSAQDIFAAMRKQRRAAAPPVPVLHAGDRLHPHEAAIDPQVVAIKQTVYRTGTDSELMETLIDAARARQGGDGGGRADGALRRGGEHQLGRAARGGRRARGLRRRRPQDPRQDGADGAARGTDGTAAALRAPRHGQLPPAHRAPVHRLRPAHLRTRRSAPTSTRCSSSSPASGARASCKHVWQSPFTLHSERDRRDPQRGRAWRARASRRASSPR